MKRDAALERLDLALGEAIGRMFTILETSFVDPKKDNGEAKKHFESGIDCQLEAHAYATKIITEKFEA